MSGEAAKPRGVKIDLSLEANKTLDTTKKEPSKVAKEIAADWRKVASFLNSTLFPSREIKVIEDTFRRPFDQAKEMIDTWSSELGNKATRRVLIEAMLECGLRAQANNIFTEELVDYVKPLK
ncbi:uncharacterized protein LOC134190101 [Corticium candelabrum]|uniref:uncharacterized protein LOC134190101 n=1 Tax=Corticium candelabrum TaxID=121492 RepID=UPI002E276FCB|nr:uncharacterized protein LOC134190101 [Corticium candelabrum]